MQSPNPPLGLAYIAASLKEADLPYQVIDATGEGLDSIVPYPGRSDFRVQGLSVEEICEAAPSETTVFGLHCNFSHLWPITNVIAKRLRETFPNALIILGGEHGTALYEFVLKSSPFDVVVMGEGDETIINLVQAHEQGRDFTEVQGISFVRDGSVVLNGLSKRIRNIDKIPIPDWDNFPIMEYINRHQINGINLGRSMPILGTRGCPYKCTFCSNVDMWTQRYVRRDPKVLVDEMEIYIKKYNVSNFDFQDATALVSRKWTADLCNEILDRKLDITWQLPSGTRSETFDEDLAQLLYRAGCRALSFAPESGAEEILIAVHKQVNLRDMLERMRVATKVGLKLSCFIVIGFPTETKATLKKTLKLIRTMALVGVHDVAVSKFVPYPGSPLFNELYKADKIKLDDEFFISPMDFYNSNAASQSEEISPSKLYRTMLWMFLNFYIISFVTHPFRTAKTIFNAVFFKKEGTRYAKWLVDYIYTKRKWRRATISAASEKSNFSEPLTSAQK